MRALLVQHSILGTPRTACVIHETCKVEGTWPLGWSVSLHASKHIHWLQDAESWVTVNTQCWQQWHYHQWWCYKCYTHRATPLLFLPIQPFGLLDCRLEPCRRTPLLPGIHRQCTQSKLSHIIIQQSPPTSDTSTWPRVSASFENRLLRHSRQWYPP